MIFRAFGCISSADIEIFLTSLTSSVILLINISAYSKKTEKCCRDNAQKLFRLDCRTSVDISTFLDTLTVNVSMLFCQNIHPRIKVLSVSMRPPLFSVFLCSHFYGSDGF